MAVQNIKKLRTKLGLNQVEFAQLSGVHPITVSKWERREAAPTPYQNALFEEFNKASRDREICKSLKNLIIAAGVAIALALLLRHLIKK